MFESGWKSSSSNQSRPTFRNMAQVPAQKWSQKWDHIRAKNPEKQKVIHSRVLSLFGAASCVPICYRVCPTPCALGTRSPSSARSLTCALHDAHSLFPFPALPLPSFSLSLTVFSSLARNFVRLRPKNWTSFGPKLGPLLGPKMGPLLVPPAY